MLNMILKRYVAILLSILVFGAFQQAIAQETDDTLEVEAEEQEAAVVTEAQAPITEKKVKGRGGSGWGVGSSYTTTSVIAYTIRTSIADESNTSQASSHNAVPSVMYRNKKFISYRFAVAQFDYSDTITEKKGDSSYKLGVNFALGNDTFITNLHPFGGRFYFALGITDFELKLGFGGSVSGEASETQEDIIDPKTGGPLKVTSEVTGRVGGSLAYEGLATYTGLGWGTKHPDKRGFGMRFELAVIQVPKPKVNLYANGFKAAAAVDVDGEEREISTEAIDAEINQLVSDTAKYERDLEKDAAQLDIFPVIEIGFSYHF